MLAGSLEIQMLANMARLQADMDVAKKSVTGAMGAIDSAVDGAKKTLAGLAGGLTVAAFAGWIRGAIDAADETSKMSQKLGMATQQVAGLQLAFRQAGVGGEFEQSMGKLAKSAAEGSEAFRAMGINVKNNDGTLKNTRALLGEVADAMAGYEDGTAKIALAQELFGKSGAQLIPLLNAGAEGLDEYDAIAKKLGLTLSEDTAKSAEKFNDTLDLIGQGSQGVARQVAAQLLPTLSGLADQFFTSMSNGDKLRNVADFLSTSFKVLYIAGVAIVEVFSTVGKTIGAAAAQLVAMAQLDFSGAAAIGREWAQDVGTNWKDTLKQIEGAWNTTGSASMESMAGTQAAIKKAAPQLKDLEDQTKKQTKAEKDLEEARKKADAELLKLMQTRAAARKKEEDAIEDYLQAEERRRIATVKASADAVAAAQDEFDNYGKTKSQIAEVTLARLQDKLQAYHAGSENAKAVEAEIENHKKLIAILQRGEARDAYVEATKQATAQSNALWASVDKTAHDTFVNIFAGGQDAFTKLRDVLKATLLDLLYQMTLKKWIFDLSASFSGSGIGSLLNLGSAASGSPSMGSLGSIGSSVGQWLGIGGGTTAASAAVSTPVVGGTAGVVATELAPLGATGVTGAAAGTGAVSSGLGALPILGGFVLGMKLLGQGQTDGLPSEDELWRLQHPGEPMPDHLKHYFDYYAAGGDHSGGWRIVGEEGMELEATGPSRIFSASQTKDILSGDGGRDDTAVLQALAAVQEELAAIRVSAAATAAASRTTARLIDASANGGQPLRIEATT